MNTFVAAVVNQNARTSNGMKARQATASKAVDLFYKAGAMRGKNIVPDFVGAYVENRNYALRIAQWLRDVREGAGERQLFKDILLKMADTNVLETLSLMKKVPELGRWDDLLVFFDKPEHIQFQNFAIELIGKALEDKNGLCAKWMPRQGPIAARLRVALGYSPKAWRKLLVSLTKVVETQMCQNEWDGINFNHVPSLAASRYKKAFYRHTPKFKEYVEALVKGDPTVKVNAGAVYPYDITKTIRSWNPSKTEIDHAVAQWNALPNYVGDNKVLALVDVSGSMICPAGGYNSKSKVTCLDVAVSLGLYVADKNTGPFKDTFLTFSGSPELLHLNGNIAQKISQMNRSKWEMNTNLHAALEKILSTAINGNVDQEDMPNMLLIMSDMQFDACVTHDDSAIEMIGRKYVQAGYSMPQVVFWNLNAYDNAPVKYDTSGVALVSGFSPSILKSVLSAKIENFTPEAVMLETIMKPRYDL